MVEIGEGGLAVVRSEGETSSDETLARTIAVNFAQCPEAQKLLHAAKLLEDGVKIEDWVKVYLRSKVVESIRIPMQSAHHHKGVNIVSQFQRYPQSQEGELEHPRQISTDTALDNRIIEESVGFIFASLSDHFGVNTKGSDGVNKFQETYPIYSFRLEFDDNHKVTNVVPVEIIQETPDTLNDNGDESEGGLSGRLGSVPSRRNINEDETIRKDITWESLETVLTEKIKEKVKLDKDSIINCAEFLKKDEISGGHLASISILPVLERQTSGDGGTDMTKLSSRLFEKIDSMIQVIGEGEGGEQNKTLTEKLNEIREAYQGKKSDGTNQEIYYGVLRTKISRLVDYIAQIKYHHLFLKED